ncbi:MAG: carboxypeptidase-like regulatory domain-containing protein [Chitinophagaceae bacterium]
MRILPFLCCLMIFALQAKAVVWKGCLQDAESAAPLLGATITNTRSAQSVQTDRDGNFEIEGSEGDRVTFVCPGYATETHIILKGLEGIRLTFRLRMSGLQLREVIIKQRYKTIYQRDSADRASTYTRTLADKKASIASPVSFLADRLSRQRRAVFRFQRDFRKNRDRRFVDSRDSPELTNSRTGLSGDTLAYFLCIRTQMPYDYARSASTLELRACISPTTVIFCRKPIACVI